MDHIQALFEGQDLSDEFKAKATSILEAAVAERTQELRESIEAELKEDYEAKIEAKTKELEELSEQYVEEHIIPTIDQYLTLATKEWLEENKIALEEGARVELADSFLKGLVGLAESHNLDLPKSDLNKLDELNDTIKSLEESLVELKLKNQELSEEIVKFEKDAIVNSLTESLSDLQKEKIQGVIEKVKFKDKDQFSSAVKDLIESYYPVNEEEEEEAGDKEGKEKNKEGKDKKEKLEESKGYLDVLLNSL